MYRNLGVLSYNYFEIHVQTATRQVLMYSWSRGIMYTIKWVKPDRKARYSKIPLDKCTQKKRHVALSRYIYLILSDIATIKNI